MVCVYDDKTKTTACHWKHFFEESSKNLFKKVYINHYEVQIVHSVVQKKKNNKLPIINCIVIGFSEYFQNHILHIMVFKMNRIFRKFKHMYLQCGCKNEFLWWVDWKQLQQIFSQISHNFLPHHFKKTIINIR